MINLNKVFLSILFTFVFVSFISATDYKYKWGHPKPQGNPIYGVVFVDSLTGFAVTGCGMILKTTDWGENWFIIRDTDANYRDLYDIINIQNGILLACGENGIILRSADNGESWIEINTTFDNDLSDLAIVPGGDVSIAGANGTVLRSSNNGIDWAYIGLNNEKKVLHHFWKTSNEGYVAGNDFYRTTDSGNTWQFIDIFSGFNFNEVFFTNPDTGYVFTDFNTFRTIDGGNNWTDNYQHETNNYHFRSLVFSDTNWLSVSFGEGAAFHKTTNAGETWQRYYDLAGAVGFHYLYKGFGNRLFYGSDIGDIYYSDDFGLTYSIATLNIGGSFPATLGRDGRVVAFYKRADGILFSIIEASSFVNFWMQSNDGGYNWHKLVNQPFISASSNINFWDNQVGIVTNYNTISYTKDGGINWAITNLPDNHRATEIAIPNNDKFFVSTYQVNGGGALFLSADSGKTWNIVNDGLPSNIKYFNLQFINPQIGFISGFVDNQISINRLFKTSDGGSSWSEISTLGVNRYFFDMHWLKEDTAIASIYNNEDGGIFRTVDCGSNWEKVLSYPNVSNLFFHNDSWGTALQLNNSGIFLETIDGGLTWSETQVPISSAKLFSLFSGLRREITSMFPIDSGWVIGSSGNAILVAKTDNPTSINSGDKFNDFSNMPNSVQLICNYPNPFNPSTKIIFRVKEYSKIKMTVYNILGQTVKELLNSYKEAGEHNVVWNAKDNSGFEVGTGVYFISIQTENNSDFLKVLLLK